MLDLLFKTQEEVKNVPKSLFLHFDDEKSRSFSFVNTLQMQNVCTGVRINFL
jgi:hypothetical protein